MTNGGGNHEQSRATGSGAKQHSASMEPVPKQDSDGDKRDASRREENQSNKKPADSR